jgi:hypothetical protein
VTVCVEGLELRSIGKCKASVHTAEQGATS